MNRTSITERFHDHEVLAEKFYLLDVKIMKMLDAASFCRELPRQVAELFGVPHAWLSIIDDSKAARYVRGKDESALVSREIFAQLLPDPEEPLVINEGLDPYFRLLPGSRREHFCSLALIPLHLNGELVGSLNQADADPHRFDSNDNRIYLQRLAVKLSLGLSNLIAHEQVRHQAYHDPLTSLRNRRAMEGFLSAELARIARYGGVLTVVFIDLDRIKRVNDSFGHDSGDALLKYLADGLCNMCRQSDLVARLAGDKFVLILPQTDPGKAAKLLARIEAEFMRRPLLFEGEALTARISFGLAASTEQLKPVELLKLADTRLYEAKRLKQSV